VRSAVLFSVRAIQRLVHIVLIVPALGFLLLFALQFFTSPRLHGFWPIQRLQDWGNPVVAWIGSWVRAPWPSSKVSFFPLGLAIAAWLVVLAADAIFEKGHRLLGRLLLASGPRGVAVPRPGSPDLLGLDLRGVPTDSEQERGELLKRYREIESALKLAKRKRCAFLAVDVVGSTQMKVGEDDTDVAATFQAYEELLKTLFDRYAAWKVAWTPDGVMACFLRLEFAVATGQSVLRSLPQFNETENRLRTPFRVRCGLNEGEVKIYEDTKLEKVADHVIDVAGHMQKQGMPNSLWLSDEIYNVLSDKEGFRPTGQVVDGLASYEWTVEPRRAPVQAEAAAAARSAIYRTGLVPPTEVQQIGRYEILGELGRGAMGAVYKARDPQIGRTVAIKIILVGNQTPEELESFKKRFYREAQTAGQMSHPGIVTIYDVNEDEFGQPYLVMEFIEGTTLDKLLSAGASGRRAPRPLKESLDLAIQVADALDYAHRHNVIHRDIKPANILVTPEGKTKIADFGIAKMAGTQMTHTGLLVGTPAFMSPEQITGQPVDSRSDLFSFGIVFYWMCTGTKPFAGQAITEVAYKVVHATPTPVCQLNAELPPGLGAIISRCLAKKPDDRYATARDLVADLEVLRAGLLMAVATQPPTSSAAS
jgi:class 3 adenylate cyclase